MSKIIGPVIIDDFFTEEEIEIIYAMVNEKMDKGVAESGDKWQEFNKNPSNGFIAIMDGNQMPQVAKNKFEKNVTRLIEEPSSPSGGLWARYSLESEHPPSLLPHCDRSEIFTGYYCNVQLEANIDWDFYVLDEKIPMKRNRAVFFTGTHQPHWRPDYDFKDGDFYDIILFQASALKNYETPNPEKITEEFRDQMDAVCDEYIKKYQDILLIGSKKNFPRY